MVIKWNHRPFKVVLNKNWTFIAGLFVWDCIMNLINWQLSATNTLWPKACGHWNKAYGHLKITPINLLLHQPPSSGKVSTWFWSPAAGIYSHSAIRASVSLGPRLILSHRCRFIHFCHSSSSWPNWKKEKKTSSLRAWAKNTQLIIYTKVRQKNNTEGCVNLCCIRF